MIRYDNHVNAGDLVQLAAVVFIAGGLVWAFNNHLEEPYHTEAGEQIHQLALSTQSLVQVVQHNGESIEDLESNYTSIEERLRSIELHVARLLERNGIADTGDHGLDPNG